MNLFLLFFIFKNIFSSVSVEAEVDKNRVPMGSTFTYTISVQTDMSQSAGDLTLTELDADFDVVNQYESSGYSSTYINGRFESSTTKYYKYLLSPKSEGIKTIPQIVVEIDGVEYKTKSIEIEVVKGYGNQYKSNNNVARPNPAPKSLTNTNTSNISYFDVKAIVEKSDVYVGEQIIVSYYLMTKVSIDNPDIYKRPEFSGFIKEDLETITHLNFENQIIDGEAYKVALLAKYAVYPLKVGTSYIDSMSFKATAMMGNNLGQGAFGSFFNFRQPREISRDSNTIKITAKKIPTQNQPSTFFGAIGDFNLSSKLSANSVKTGTPVSLFITYKGRGNLASLEKPNLKIPNSIEVYEVKDSVSLNALGGGEKIFEFVLIPRLKGVNTIEKYDFSYFDPNQDKFITKSIAEINITAEGDYLAGANTNYDNTKNIDTKEKTNILLNKDIRYIKEKPLVVSEVLFFNILYYLVYLISLILFLFFILKLRFSNKNQVTIDMVKKESSELLKKAINTSDQAQSLKYFSLAIINILAFKVFMSKYAHTSDEILAKFYEISKDQALIDDIKHVLNLSNELRYKGQNQNFNKDELLANIKKILKRIDS